MGSLRQSGDPTRSLSEPRTRIKIAANLVKLASPVEPPPTDRHRYQHRHLMAMVTRALRKVSTNLNTITLMSNLSSLVNERTRRHTTPSPTDNNTHGKGTMVNRRTTTVASITVIRSDPQSIRIFLGNDIDTVPKAKRRPLVTFQSESAERSCQQ